MNATLCLCLFILIFIGKLVFLMLFSGLGYDFFGGGNDSNYYHAYALGSDDIATSVWPIALRLLNEMGFYSRSAVSGILFVVGSLIVPYMAACLSAVKYNTARHKVYWAVMLLLSLYPTLFYYGLDIYRDVLMVCIFLCGLFVMKSLSSEGRGLVCKMFLFLAGVAVAYILYLFRPYLGFAFFTSLALSGFYSFKRYPFLISFLFLLFVLNIFYEFGVLDPALKYRSIFSENMLGGTNLGILFSSTVTFVPDFIKSMVSQIFGFYFVNISSIIVFVLESVPFLVALFYLVKNRKYSSGFVDALIVFFVVYSVIWVLGNDNLGTAVRLRMFSYISIYIACAVVYQNKVKFIVGK